MNNKQRELMIKRFIFEPQKYRGNEPEVVRKNNDENFASFIDQYYGEYYDFSKSTYVVMIAGKESLLRMTLPAFFIGGVGGGLYGRISNTFNKNGNFIGF